LDNTREIFTTNLRRLRNERDLTQDEAAVLIDTSSRYYQRLEHGKSFPSPEYIDRICKAFGVELVQLFIDPHSELYPRSKIKVKLVSLLKYVSDDHTEVLISIVERIRRNRAARKKKS
jgi:transcriptional regulator with XRE-family HTH domain